MGPIGCRTLDDSVVNNKSNGKDAMVLITIVAMA
jgi:hypothetical protein